MCHAQVDFGLKMKVRERLQSYNKKRNFQKLLILVVFLFKNFSVWSNHMGQTSMVKAFNSLGIFH